MKTPLLTLAALCIAAPAWAQVPATAGAPSDRPMPPEPGQTQGTDRTLNPAETNLPQADNPTRSEREQMGQEATTASPANAGAQGQTNSGQMQTGQMPPMSSGGGMPAMADMSRMDRTAYDRAVRDQFTAYDRNIEEHRMMLRNAPPDQRAEHALMLIRMRRQSDALRLQHRGLRRADEAQYRTMRDTLTRDMMSYDQMMRESTMDGQMQNRPMNNSTTGGNN